MKMLKLQDIAFNIIVTKLWKCSKLPVVSVDTINRNFTTVLGLDFRKFTEQRDDTLKCLQNVIMEMQFPRIWKIAISRAIDGLDSDISTWGEELVANLVEGDREKVAFCLQRIDIDQRGMINYSNTICQILEDSQFKIHFAPEFLADYCIEKDRITEISVKVINQLTKGRTVRHYRTRASKQAKQVCKDDLDAIKRIVSKCYEVNKYWTVKWMRAQDNWNDRYWHTTLIQYILGTRIYATLEYFHYKMNIRMIREHLANAVKYFCKNDYLKESNCTLCGDYIAFFYAHLDSNTWLEILERNFYDIFYALIKSWRHINLCVKFFLLIKDIIDLNTYQAILLTVKERLKKWRCGSYEYPVMIEVLLSIWKATPYKLRYNKKITFQTIPQFVILDDNYKPFAEFLLEIDMPLRREIAGHGLLYLLVQNKTIESVEEYLHTLNQRALLFDDYKELCDIHTIKSFLTTYKGDPINLVDVGCLLDEYILKPAEARMLKTIMRNDEHFIISYLCHIKYSCFTAASSPINWLCNDNADDVEVYTRTILENHWMLKIYRNLMIDSGTNVDNQIFYIQKVFELPQTDVIYIMLKLFEDESFQDAMFCQTIKELNSDFLLDYRTFLFPENQTSEHLQRFLFSEFGLTTVLDLILYIDSVEEELPLRFSFMKLYSVCVNFKDLFITPYGLEWPYDIRLSQYGHPNLRNRELKLKNAYALNKQEMLVARKHIDVKYRAFRAFLRMDFQETFLNRLKYREDILEVSNIIAREANITIDVIL